MIPLNSQQEKAYRKKKREKEIEIALKSIRKYLDNTLELADKPLEILEFGSGDGFQIPYLEKLGRLTASDIYASDDIKSMKAVNFIKCSIADTPFQDRQFDLIFSSQVIEHVKELKKGFKEMKRIGADNCLYAFTVPTNVWLLISIPGQYYVKYKAVINKFIKKSKTESNKEKKSSGAKPLPAEQKSLADKIKFAALPIGHGVEQKFLKCYRNFRIKNWQKLFRDNGFKIIKTAPLLLAGPSEWPLIPISVKLNKYNICSSVLFLLEKN